MSPIEEIRAAFEGLTHGAWTLDGCYLSDGRLTVHIEVNGAPELVLEAESAAAGAQAFRVLHGFAFSYRGRELHEAHRAHVEPVVIALAELVREHGLAAIAAPEATIDVGDIEFPTPYEDYHLDEELGLPETTVSEFRNAGHVLVRRALNPHVVKAARPHMLAAIERQWPRELVPTEEREDAYSRSFTQLADVWRNEPASQDFGLRKRLTGMAAQLLGVQRVRLFCENWLIKEPGADITPWHQDGVVMPFEIDQTIAIWIPLQTVREVDGLLRFARGSHQLERAGIDNINDESEGFYDALIAEHGFAIDRTPPVFPGDVSFHHGRTIHGAFPNRSDAHRVVLVLHCFADGARIVEPTSPTMAQLLASTDGGLQPGDPATDLRWPLIYPNSPPRVRVEERARPLHFRVRPLAHGGELTDVWVRDGRFTFSEVGDADTVCDDGRFAIAGLVECHGHLSFPTDPSSPVHTEQWMNERRREYAGTGVTLVRDQGSIGDEILELSDVPGLPRFQASGLMVLPHDDPPFTPTTPDGVVRAFADRIEKGAHWVKVFSDWSSDFEGKGKRGFTGRDPVSYPLPILTEAVRVAHELGGRVSSHCFTREGAEVAIRAGADSLEHGWGVDEALLDEMLEHGTAWAPLAGIASNMWNNARALGQNERVKWIENAIEHLSRTLPLAEERGITILAGTDMFPSVSVPDEIAQLNFLGVSRQTALAAGSWVAREWLGEPGIVEGAPADLVLFRDDPRDDLHALLKPSYVMIGGVEVPSPRAWRPRFFLWDSREEAPG